MKFIRNLIIKIFFEDILHPSEYGDFALYVREYDWRKYSEGWCKVGGSNGWHCSDKELFVLFREYIKEGYPDA